MQSLTGPTRRALQQVADSCGTPSYAYFPERAVAGLEQLEGVFGEHFTVSFAIKCNPNVGLLRSLRSRLRHVDASSIAEIERALAAGYPPPSMSFSGPAKRDAELARAIELGVGAIVCESEAQLARTDELARSLGTRASVLLRINPRNVPKKFGLHMAGRAGQFGVDEEACDEVLARLRSKDRLDFAGFHVFSGTNSLSVDAIAENFAIMVELFGRFADAHGITPRMLVFGAGFGIPYFPGDEPLDLVALGARINPLIETMRRSPRLASAQCLLELGRWLVGPHGYLLTSVVAAKHSRGTDILLCDAGFNNHLSACGMMGTVIRRNWQFWNLRADGPDQKEYLLVGPLCASFDQLAANLTLPETHVGDVLAVASSGAYGLTASPTRFISHPEPREYLVFEGATVRIDDVTESTLNHPPVRRTGIVRPTQEVR